MPEWIDTNVVSVVNGLAIGCLLFILASGLSLVFGMMNVLNLAHGAVFLVGAYAAFAFTDGDPGWSTFLLAVAVALLVGLGSGVVLALLIQPLAGRGHLDQALLTLGVALVVAEVMILAFGSDVRSVGVPPGLDQTLEVGDQDYPVYRLALIAIGLTSAALLHLIVERTRVGTLIRATVADREMIEALGTDTRKVMLGVFAAGCGLAAIAGALGGPIYGARPGLDESVLLLALVVVVIGGLGSVKGALLGALLIGQVESLGRAHVPDQAAFLLFGAMALVLLLRPQGLVGVPGVRH